MNESRNITEPIKREVRQRCGFGCVVCGFPIYEYEHMEEWAKVKRHIASEITLLCDIHHREKTYGLLPKEDVIKANKSPYNLRTGVSSPYNFKFSGTDGKIQLGGTSFNTKDIIRDTLLIPFLVYDNPLVLMRIIDKNIFLNLNIYDEFDNLILRILDNELIYKSNLFDITFIGKTITIRGALGIIILEIEFRVPNMVIFKRGNLQFKNVKIKMNDEGCVVSKANKEILELGRIDFLFSSVVVVLQVGGKKPIFEQNGIKHEMPVMFLSE
jgi:trigger factor